MPAQVEVRLCELRRRHPDWGQRRLAHELVREGGDPPPGLTGIYRALLRNGLIELRARRRRKAAWRRWERDRPMQLWQMDVMGGVWRRRPPCPGLLVVAGARQPGRVHAGTIGITQATLPIPAVATALLPPAS